MTTKRHSTPIVQSHTRLIGAALALAFTLAGSPLLAAEVHASQPHPAASAKADDVSPSRINGREDWDTDYPSQLAPQVIRPAAAQNAQARIDAEDSSSAPARTEVSGD